MSGLMCGDNIVSAHLGFTGRNRFYYVMPAYDIRYRALAPGYQLLDHLMSQCRDDGYEAFDLGEGEHPYKEKWVTHQVPLRTYQRAVTVAGMIYLQANRIRRRLDIQVPDFLPPRGRACRDKSLIDKACCEKACSNKPCCDTACRDKASRMEV